MDNNEPKEYKIIFDEGCFDEFDGTQEELDALTAEITRLVETGELFENATLIEDLDDEEDSLINSIITHTRQ